ncbi:MAG TPA: SBBP repeat-containing protein [Chitinophagales bacterium]|nr:SBBP repeat-containing protein [Chitinophagales bacterium]
MKRIGILLFLYLIISCYTVQAQCGLDIFIANDQSGSVDDVENAQGKYFITELMRNLDPWGTANNQSRMAIAQWDSYGTWQQFNFPSVGKNYSTQLSDVIAHQLSTRASSGWTDPYDALLKTYYAINQTPVAGRNINKIIVLMTDAYCNQIQRDIEQLATQIKDEGIYIMVLAIDGASSCSVLQGSKVASPGAYFSASSYAQLQQQAIQYAKNIRQQACSFPPQPPPTFDLSIQLNSFNVTGCQLNGTGGTYSTTYKVSNIGDSAFSNTLKISFYNENPKSPTAKLLAVQTLNNINIAMNGSYIGSFSNNVLSKATELFAVVNMDGNTTLPLPYNLKNLLFINPEKKAYNNLSNRSTINLDASCKPRATVNTTVSHTGIACDGSITYNIELCNTGNATAYIDEFNPIAPPQFILKENSIIPGDADIQRVWATFYGGDLHDYINKVVTDYEGNVYIVGYTESVNDISTINAFQTAKKSSGDGFIAKFNSQGDLQWSTYFGANGIDEIFAIAIDQQGYLYVAGKISGGDNTLATPGSNQPSYGGYDSDGILAKFNKEGERQWSTFYGGFDIDYITSLYIDKNDFVYIAGATSTAYNSNNNNIGTYGTYRSGHFIVPDGFLAKFNSDGVRQWGSYFGGEKFDNITAIVVDDESNIYVAGSTNSLPTYISTPGAHQVTFGGGNDDIALAKFNHKGQRIWATFYGGTGNEKANALAIDPKGDIYMFGTTTSPDNIATVGSHQSTYSGSDDAFLAKFNNDGVRKWATYYGGAGGDEGFGLVTDAYGYVYISGYSNSSTGIATLNNYQSDYFDKGDAFLAKFNENGIRQWGSYYGGSEPDGAKSIAIDRHDNIYIAGSSRSPNNIASTGAYQTTPRSSTLQDGFLAKFAIGNGFPIAPNSCRSFQYTYNIGNAAPGTYNYSVGFNAVDQNPTTEYPSIILPDKNFNAGAFTNLNGFNGANHTSDNATIPANLPTACTPGDKVSTAISITPNNTCGNNFAQATITINNTAGVALLNTVLELNLSGVGASYAGEIYNVSSTLSYPTPFILDAKYPNIPEALYTKKGIVRIPLWSLPAGTTTFNIDISLGASITNLSVKVSSINSNYNATGQSNTAILSQQITVPIAATIDGFSCPASISSGESITFSGISTTNASSIKWASSSVASLPNTGSITNPAIIYTPTAKDLANGFVAISLTALNSNGCETTRSCQIIINYVVYDYGDAPLSYDLNSNLKPYAGCATLHSDIYLGVIVPSAENSSKFSSDAKKDGAEEDGLVNNSCGSQIVNHQNFTLTVQASNNSNIPAYISAFIDWNNDGDYLDDGETVLNIVQANMNSGTKEYTLQFKPETANVTIDKYFIRLRISTDSISVKQPYGTAPQGEVEDHLIKFSSSSTFNNPQSICQGNSYTVNGHTYSTAGTYRDTLKNAAVGGCDSIIVTTLSLKSASTFNNPQSICNGSSYTVNGKNYNTAGTYRDTLKNSAVGGCDSIIVTTLTLKTSPTFNNPQSICNGSSYTVNGKIYSTAGTYRDTLKNAAVGGCDSIIVTTLSLKSASTFTNPQSICQGSFYTVNGNIYTSAGTYRDTLKNAAVGGCDSIIVTTLSMKSASTFTNPQSICQGSSYTVNGKNYTTAGTYRDTLKNAAVGGCDSIIVTTLTLKTSPTFNNPQSICQGSSYTVNGHIYSSAGTYRDTLKNAAVGGCDSIIVTTLSLKSASTFNNPQSICQGSSYTVNGKNYTTAGTYRDTLKNAAVGGCDSIIVTNLTLKTSSTFNNPQSICQGSSYTINGKNYTTAGTYRDTLKNAAVGGCDSIIVTVLSLNFSITSNNPQSICQGSSYTVNGKIYSTAGTYRDTLKNVAVGGCDSIIVTILTINSSITSNNPQSICQGSTYTINGKIYSTAGTYRDTLKNAALGGCDSIIVTTLSLKSASTFNNPQSICQGSSYTINGKNYTTAGTYRDTLKNAALGGCDSIIVTVLSLNPSITSNNPQSICNGSSYTVNGKNYTTAGTYRDTLKNAAVGGCDSIIVTTLSIKSASTFNNPQSICNGSSYTVNGKIYSTAGTYRDTLKNVAVGGCDSIIVTTLSLKSASTFNNPQSICQGSSYIVNGKIYTTTGTYRDTLKNAAVGGCDSIIVTILTINSSITSNNPQSICQGSSYTINGKNYTTAGTYRDTLKNAALDGCDSIIVTTLSLTNSLKTILNETICNGKTFTVGNQSFNITGQYDVLLISTVSGCDSTVQLSLKVFEDGFSEEIQTICPEEIIYWNNQEIEKEGIYQNIFINQSGCDSIAQLTVNVLDTCQIQSEDCYLMYPNVFTPNGDGNNDSFRPIYNCELENYLLEIYNRWGVLVFTSTDPKIVWDGRNINEILQDNYVYYAQFLMNGQQQTVKGYVLVLP